MSGFKPAVVTAGILLALSDMLEQISPGAKFSEQVVTPTYRVAAICGLLGCFVLALALVGLQARQAHRTGRGATVAAVFAGFGAVLLFAVEWSTTFVDPAAAKVYPAFVDDTPPAILVAGFFGSLLWFGLSWLVYAVVMLRAGVLARVPLVVLAIAALATAAPFVPFAMTLFGAALAWLGASAVRAPVPALVPAT